MTVSPRCGPSSSSHRTARTGAPRARSRGLQIPAGGSRHWPWEQYGWAAEAGENSIRLPLFHAPRQAATNMPSPYDYLIVGAGFAGAVLAERLASQCGQACLVVDRRDHIGGNAYDRHDARACCCSLRAALFPHELRRSSITSASSRSGTRWSTRSSRGRMGGSGSSRSTSTRSSNSSAGRRPARKWRRRWRGGACRSPSRATPRR